MARALRSGAVPSRSLRLLPLVREVLAWFDEAARRDVETASIALPQVAQVIELKVRLMLPAAPAPSEHEDEEDDQEAAARAVELLAELESAIAFLRRRRQERATLLPVRTERPSLPRRERPLRATAGTLQRLAGRLRRQNGYFELALDRLTLQEGMRRLRTALTRRRRGTLWELVPTHDWIERTVVFSAFLELVREGRARGHQDAPFSEIEVETLKR